MTPSAAIAMLDRQLLRHGQPVTLRRLTLVDGEQEAFDCTCKAVVRQYQPAELVDGIIQGDSHVVLSPTDLSAAVWPGVGLPPVPRKGDRVVVAGTARNIEAVVPFYIGTQVVRIECQVRG